MKILLAVDGSPFTKRMLGWLGAQGWLDPKNEFTIAHVVPPLPASLGVNVVPGVVSSYYDEESESVLRPIRAFLAEHKVAAECLHRVGDPATTLSELAESPKHDLVVMGSHGRTALAGLVMGSVTTAVLARCRVPVLVIR